MISSIDCRPIIAGNKLPGTGDRRELINPADETVIGTVGLVRPADVERAVAIAAGALGTFSRIEPGDRGRILVRATNILADRLERNALDLTLEQGKTLAEATIEWQRAIETFVWHGERAEALNAATPDRTGNSARSVRPEPIGVVAALTPWNYPAVIIARKLAAALVAGCPVILKGAEETPSSAIAIAEALLEAGLPPDALHVLFGDPAQISTILFAQPAVRAVSFTGSTPVGKLLVRQSADNLVRLVLELGGHSPVLICDDADLDGAAKATAGYKYDCAGQSCNAPSRVFVTRRALDRFVEIFAELSRGVVVGPGTEPGVTMGPLANRRRLAAITGLVEDARRRGSTIALGGARIDRRGFFYPPTILLNVPADCRVFAEEPFGPILPIIAVDSEDEMIERANATRFGLASYVFTQDKARAERLAGRLVAGSIGINEMRGVPPEWAVGGVRDSGYGYEGGRAGVQAFQNLKLVSGL